jgi:hypothetical protein
MRHKLNELKKTITEIAFVAIKISKIKYEKEKITGGSDYLLFCKWKMSQTMFYNLLKRVIKENVTSPPN